MDRRLWMNTVATIDSVVMPLSGRMMAAYREPCRILGAHITRVARGDTESIICDQYCEADGGCQLRRAALEGGASHGTPDILSEGVVSARTRCVMLTA
jgi:hypothetical protein